MRNVSFHIGDEFVEWDLTDVNVLNGSNGSGKSSLLMKIVDTYQNAGKINYICSNYTRVEMDSLLDLLTHNFHNLNAEKQSLFLDVIQRFLCMSGKSLDVSGGRFLIRHKKTSVDILQSSLGEKRLFLILLTAFLQKEGTLIIDEPEMSLHTDWQELLIEGIKRVNEELQIIVATHSPSIVINGWHDKVVEITSIKR